MSFSRPGAVKSYRMRRRISSWQAEFPPRTYEPISRDAVFYFLLPFCGKTGASMNLEYLGNIGDFVGGVAVVATLVYVAIQLAQNNRLLRPNTAAVRASGTTAITELLVNVNQTLLGDASLCEIFLRGLAEPESLRGADKLRFEIFLQNAFVSHENAMKLARSGAIESEDWEPWSRHLEMWLGFPAVQSWWARQDSPFSDEVRAHVNELKCNNA